MKSKFDRLGLMIIFIPVWLLTLCFRPFFPEGHPWKNKKLTLVSWIECGTPFAFYYSIHLWLLGLLGLFLGSTLSGILTGMH